MNKLFEFMPYPDQHLPPYSLVVSVDTALLLNWEKDTFFYYLGLGWVNNPKDKYKLGFYVNNRKTFIYLDSDNTLDKSSVSYLTQQKSIFVPAPTLGELYSQLPEYQNVASNYADFFAKKLIEERKKI